MALAACSAVRQAEWDAQVILFRCIKYPLDERGIKFDVGHHNQDVPRSELGVLLEPIEQMIVEHLHFAQRTMAGMNLNRSVVLGDGFLLRLALSTVAQNQDIGLDAGQHGFLTRLNHDLSLLPIPCLVNQVQEIPSELAH